MKLSFATIGCPDWKIDQVASQGKALGFDGVELRGIAGDLIGPEEPPQERTRIRKLFESAGLEICCIMGYSKFTNEDPSLQEENIRIALQFLDVAGDVGCPRLRVFGGNFSKNLDRTGNLARVVEGLKRVAGHAEKKKIQVVLETHDDWVDSGQVREVLDRVRSPLVGVCWDVCNTFFGESAETSFKALRPHLLHVHFKDGARCEGKIQSRLPGKGEVDLKKVLTILHASGYKDYLTFEWEKKWQPQLEGPEVAFPHFIQFIRNLMGRMESVNGLALA